MNILRLNIIYALLVAVLLLVSACQKEAGIKEYQILSPHHTNERHHAQINVCHNDRIITIDVHAMPAHQLHGDAIDMDGDGYFDRENTCSETDCDDTDRTKNPGIEGSCSGNPNVEELLIGTWTTVDFDIQAFVGSSTLTEYLISMLGLTPEEAENQNNLFVTSLEPEIIGSLTINADHTYSSDYLGGSDMGTWSLSPDQTTLTFFEGPDTIIIIINSISSTTWEATLQDDFFVDLDDDPGTPDVAVTVIAQVTAMK